MRPSRRVVLTALFLSAFGCSDDPAAPGLPGSVERVGAAAVADTVGRTLSDSLSVRVFDTNGDALGGVQVAWSVLAGGGSLGATSTTTDPDGRAAVAWTLGTAPGDNLASAAVDGAGGVVFTATAAPDRPASVEPAVDSIGFDAVGQTRAVSIGVADRYGNPLSADPVAWASSDTSVATVDAWGLVTAAGAGAATITATADTASADVVVSVAPAPEAVSVSPVLAPLYAVGDSVRLTAVVRDRNGSEIDRAAVAWSSADTAVATVGAAGWVVARGNGAVSIEAAAGGATDQATVVVSQVVASVTVAPDTTKLGEGETVQLEAVVTDSNGVGIPAAEVIWSSDDPTTASVVATGLVTGESEGRTVVTAASDGVLAGAEVTVMGRIAFYADDGGDVDVYVMNTDGSNPVRLTDDPAFDTGPAWSPDGTRIVFQSMRDGDNEIYVMDADGSDQTRLTYDPGSDFAPAWSPDGASITFSSTRSGLYDVYVMDANGTNPANLIATDSADLFSKWSPDGSKLAFRTNRDGNAEVYIVDADGSNPVNLTGDPAFDSSPAWSPDGTRIAFISDRDGDWDIWVMEADGTNPVNITPDDPGVNAGPAWTPDGRILFTSDRDGNNEIYLVNADGTGLVNLTNSARDEYTPRWRPQP